MSERCNTLSLRQSVQLVNWMNLNHSKLVEDRMTREQAAALLLEETGISTNVNRLSNQASAMDWSDWPNPSFRDHTKPRATPNGRIPATDAKNIAYAVRDLINAVEDLSKSLGEEDIDFTSHWKRMQAIMDSPPA